MECFVTLAIDFSTLITTEKLSILDVYGVLDMPLNMLDFNSELTTN